MRQLTGLAGQSAWGIEQVPPGRSEEADRVRFVPARRTTTPAYGFQHHPDEPAGTDPFRPRPQIVARCSRLQREHAVRAAKPGAGANPDIHLIGQIAALSWFLGEARLSPLSRALDADLNTPAAVDHERHIADEMLCGRTGMDPRGRGYVVGVGLALMWIRNQTDVAL